jgi:hypothetical protein
MATSCRTLSGTIRRAAFDLLLRAYMTVVIFLAEVACDMRQRVVREIGRKIHGDLTRAGDLELLIRTLVKLE